VPQCAQGPLGAYGLQLRSSLPTNCLNPVAVGSARWDLQWQRWDGPTLPRELVTDTQATVHITPRGFATIDRRSATSVLSLASAPSANALIHPHLGSMAVLAAHWAGRQSFHSGAFIHDGRAWGILGNRNDGKSSTLAWLSLQGYPVLTDDLLIVEGDRAFPGPRCLDLREGAARRFGIGEDIGIVGSRQRFRVPLGPVPAEVPFGGWVVLQWADSVEILPASAEFRLRTLIGGRGLLQLPTDPLSWLDLTTRPMLVFRRPQDWTKLDAALNQLLDGLAAIHVGHGAMLPG
jgi:hypothetical protein